MAEKAVAELQEAGGVVCHTGASEHPARWILGWMRQSSKREATNIVTSLSATLLFAEGATTRRCHRRGGRRRFRGDDADQDQGSCEPFLHKPSFRSACSSVYSGIESRGLTLYSTIGCSVKR